MTNITDQMLSFNPHPTWHADLDTRVRPLDPLPDELATNSAWTLSFPGEHDSLPYSTILVDDVGSSGWNAKAKQAELVTFEFDLDHGNAQSKDALDEIQKKSNGLFEVRRSTGGKGLHCRATLVTPVPCEARKEYRELCRYVVSQLGEQIGIPDLLDRCCGVGCLLWFFSRRRQNERSFELLVEQTQPFEVPEDWTPPPRKVRPGYAEPNNHQDEILNCIEKHGRLDVWEGGFSTHTYAIAHAWKTLGLLGPFETHSSGSTDVNCFLIPKNDGGFYVGRYGDAPEPTWLQNEKGVCYTYLNQFDKSDWSRLVTQFGGAPLDPKRPKSVSVPLDNVPQLIKHMGGHLDDPGIDAQDAVVTYNRDTVVVEVKYDKPVFGWQCVGKRIVKSVSLKVSSPDRSTPLSIDPNAMDGIRCGIRVTDPQASLESGGSLGFYVKQKDNSWVEQKMKQIETILGGRGCSPAEIKHHLGEALTNAEKITNVPFVDEVSDAWNRGTNLSCTPEPGPYDHWNMILEHLGRDLNKPVSKDPWCQEYGIRTGRDYLFLWCVLMFQQPHRRIPYLFFWSAQQVTGKSSLANALALLIDSMGFCDAGQALRSDGGFNKEIEHAVLCKVEELDLSTNSHAYSKLKQWVTEFVISIHKKNGTPYNARNWTHWIQTANYLTHVPIAFGDERVVVVEVDSLNDPKDWHGELKPLLIEERAGFLHSLLNYPLPPPCGRLFLPVLTTTSKLRLIESSLPALNEDQQRWLDKVMVLVESTEWKGMLELKDINALIGEKIHNATWKSSWTKMELHFHARGLKPVHTPFEKRVSKASWGFELPSPSQN